MRKLADGRFTRHSSLDLGTGVSTYVTDGKGGLFGEGVVHLEEIDTVLDHSLRRELSIGSREPLSARCQITQAYELGREGWRIRVETRTAMHSTASEFLVEGRLRAFENGREAFSRDFEARIPRDLV